MILKSLHVNVVTQFIYPTNTFFIFAKIVRNITFIVADVTPISKFPKSFRITSGLIRNQFNSSKLIYSSNPGNKDSRQPGTTNPTSPHPELTPFPGTLDISKANNPPPHLTDPAPWWVCFFTQKNTSPPTPPLVHLLTLPSNVHTIPLFCPSPTPFPCPYTNPPINPLKPQKSP